MRLVRYVFLIPIGAALLAFGFANREWVTINFDPVGDTIPPVAAPLYLALFAAAAAGVVCGGVATWMGQHRHRRAARAAEAEAARLRDELDAARAVRPTLAPALARRA